MLKAALVYLPGSGGTFLHRVLTLSPKTIMGTNGANVNEYSTHYTAEQRLEKYLNWSSSDWKPSENSSMLSYQDHHADFANYAESDLWLIDKWHPANFVKEENQLLWNNTFFEWMVFINVEPKHRDFLLGNQNSKSYMYFNTWEEEYSIIKQLTEQYSHCTASLSIESFFKQQSFLDAIAVVDSKLNLELNMDYVDQLWQRWFEVSNKVWTIKPNDIQI